MSREPERDAVPDDLEQVIAACRALADRPAGEVPEIDAGELGDLRAQVDLAIAADRGWLGRLRSLSRPQRVLLVGSAAALTTVVVGLVRPRADLPEYPVGHMVLILAGLALLMGGAAWWLFRPLHRPSPRGWHRWAVAASVALVPFLLLAVPMAHVGAASGMGSAFAIGCVKCLLFGGALGLPIGLLSMAARRATVGGFASASLGGVVAGLVGNLCLQLHCPVTDPAHLWLGHAPLLVVLGAAAAWLGRRKVPVE